jgi:hypothetical protein
MFGTTERIKGRVTDLDVSRFIVSKSELDRERKEEAIKLNGRLALAGTIVASAASAAILTSIVPATLTTLITSLAALGLMLLVLAILNIIYNMIDIMTIKHNVQMCTAQG